MSTGLLHIYTGNGKGKTTAALGLAVRARAVGKRVAIVYFDKGGEHYSERALLGTLGVEWYAYGLDRIDPVTQRFRFGVIPEDVAQAEEGIAKTRELLGLRRGGVLSPPAPDGRESSPRGTQTALRSERRDGRGDVGSARPSSPSPAPTTDSRPYDLIVLDEINTTVALGMLTEQVVDDLITAKPPATELVLTGRIEVSKAARPLHCNGSCVTGGGKPHEHRPSYFDRADLVTDMHLVQHYFYTGIPAREGIDF